MRRSSMKSVLVISDTLDEVNDIIQKYDATNDVEPYVVCNYDDIIKQKDKIIKSYENILSFNSNLNNFQLETMKERYHQISEMNDNDYVEDFLDKNGYYIENDLVYSKTNANGHYKHPKLIKSPDDVMIVIPFKLNNGADTCQAKKSNINWSEIHNNKNYVFIYKRTWELCVDKEPPITEEDKTIFRNMGYMTNYFKNFKNMDEYVMYSTSYWTFGVATKDYYTELNFKYRDIDWVKYFYDTVISPLDNNKILTLIEVQDIID